MVYIIKSDSYRLLKDKLNELVGDIDKSDISYYDLVYDALNDVLDNYNNKSLFDSKKVSIIYNSNIFSTKHEYKNELELIEKYINDDKDNIMIFIVDNFSLKKSQVKKIDNQGCLFDIVMPKDKDLEKFVNDYLSNYSFKMDSIALKLLISRCVENYDYILNELDKIMIVNDRGIINKDDIEKYTIDNNNFNLFDFVGIVLKKKVDVALKKLNNIVDNVDVAIIFSAVATQYRLILSVKNLILEGFKEQEIAKRLNIHPYRIKLAHENGNNYTNNDLTKKLLYIGELDQKIKKGELDKNNALKLFLINI